MKKCINCQKEVDINAEVCVHCGRILKEEKYNIIGIIGFIISLISIYYILIGVVGFILSIVALVKIKKEKQKGKALAISGLIIGLLTTLITTFIIVVFVLFKDDIEKAACCASSGGYIENSECITSNQESYESCMNELN